MKKTILLLISALIAGWQPASAAEEPDVFRHGKLENGLTYFIRKTAAQPGCADFYLVQNVGSLMEEEDQNGLAHVLEHMAFHATANFPDGVPAFLQRHGIANFNAMTGYDETVYHIDRVSTADAAVVDSCLLVLRDWSGFLTLLPGEMEQERKVIREERRMRMTLSQRVQEMAAPYLYNHSKYADHNIIGTVEVLRNFTPEQLSRYYHDFYRPDQQAVMIIGDVDVGGIEKQIRRLFGPIPRRTDPKPRLVYRIPDNERPLYATLTDKDIPVNSLMLVKRIPEPAVSTLEELVRGILLRDFYNEIMQAGLTEYVEAGDSHILTAGAGVYDLVRNCGKFSVLLTALPGKEREALPELFRRIHRIHRYGFTDEVLQPLFGEYRKNIRASLERTETIPNPVHLEIWKRHFLEGKPLCSVREKIEATLSVLDTLSADAFRSWIAGWFDTPENWVFLMQGNNAAYAFPDASEIEKVIRATDDDLPEQSPEAAPEAAADTAFIDFEVGEGRIAGTSRIKALDAELWELGNGARVYYKYTDGEKGMFSLLAGSHGGRSLLAAEDLPSADILSALMMQNGVYKYDSGTLKRMLAERRVRMNLSLDERTESIGLSGVTESADFALQLFYLTWQRPRFDRVRFDRFVAIARMTAEQAVPTVNDSIHEALSAIRRVESPRLWKKGPAYYAAMDYDRMVEIYKDRFQDASDFTFYLVGDIGREKALSLVTRYIGTLPSVYRKEKARDYQYERRGSRTEDLEMNIPDRKYMVSIEYLNTLPVKPADELCMELIKRHFQRLLMEKIRGDQGAAYSVQVLGATTPDPARQELFVRFVTDLERGPAMRALVHEQVREFLKNGIAEEEVEDLVLALKKEKRERTEAEANTIGFWTDNLQFYNKTGKRTDAPEFFDGIIGKIDGKRVMTLARRFFNHVECVDLVIKSKQE